MLNKPQTETTTMKRRYEVAGAKDRRAIARFLKREGQFLLPMLGLVEQAELAIDEVIEVMGRATIEAVLEQLARWLEREHPSAAASLREGLDEMFTINRLALPPQLRRCLGTTNVIDNTHSGARHKSRRVTNWKNGTMALRWAAATFVETEKNYRRIAGYRHLWMLKAQLDDLQPVAEMKIAS